MREILFRGKQIFNNGQWVEGCLLKVTLDGETWHLIFGDDFQRSGLGITAMQHAAVDPATVGQYTGLKDKNGKRIFEGDIIKYACNFDYDCYLESIERPEDYEGCDYSDIFTIDKVVYCDGCAYPAFDLDDHNFDCNGLAELVASMEYHYAVIGNIHDNPELMEVR